MNELEELGTKSTANQRNKVTINDLLRNPNFEAEHCDSSILFKIDSAELETELERIKKKIQRYESVLKDRPIEFIGYASLKKNDEDKAAKGETAVDSEKKELTGNATTSSEQLAKQKSAGEDAEEKKNQTANADDEQEPEEPTNNYDLNELKRVGYK
jgi:hypothetical protein